MSEEVSVDSKSKTVIKRTEEMAGNQGNSGRFYILVLVRREK